MLQRRKQPVERPKVCRHYGKLTYKSKTEAKKRAGHCKPIWCPDCSAWFVC